nr:copia protein [Tanacetum cinerariifolium]
YALEILKKYDFDSSTPIDTPMAERPKLDDDKGGKLIDPTRYRGTIHMGLWYPKETGFALTAFADTYYAGCQDTRRSTSGSAQFLRGRLVSCVQHSRSKHIDIRYHFMKEKVERRVIELYFVETKYQLADIFTKALPKERFETLLPLLGVRQMSPDTLKELQESTTE